MPDEPAAAPPAQPLPPPPAPAYPTHWEADVVLRDGGICHLRPITPADGARLRDFHSRLSARTIYFRYFAPYPHLSDRDVDHFTKVDYNDRVALVATVGDEIVGVGRYDRVGPLEAEVAFTVRDDHQARGLGAVLLEHLAAVARERGLQRFVAEVLPGNRRMIGTFAAAGYRVAQELDEGVVRLAFDIEPTEALRSVARSREKRAEARSIARLFQPESVVIIGASRRPESLGHQIVQSLVRGGFTGRLSVIHPIADEVAGVPAYRRVADAPGPLDLAVVVVPADAVNRVVADCAAAGVHGLVVMSSGFGESGDAGGERQSELVALVRGHGMRLVGPNALGIINTDSRVRLTAALTSRLPRRGRVGVFCNSASTGVALLDRFERRKLGISSFLSVGNHADVAGPDAMHYWSNDPATRVMTAHLEGIVNPRKFIRVARDVGRHTPVVVLRSGRSSRAFPLGPVVRRTTIPPNGVDALFAQAGIIEAESLDQMLDIAGMLSCQPVPRGDRLAVVSDSAQLASLAMETAAALGLRSAGDPVVLPDAMIHQLPRRLADLTRDPDVDAVLVIVVPPTPETNTEVQHAIVSAAADSTVPVLAVLSTDSTGAMLVVEGPDGAAAAGSVPVFGTAEEALRALALVVRHEQWRSSPRGEVAELPDVDTEAARAQVEQVVARRDERDTPTVRLPSHQAARLLSYYGIEPWPSALVDSEDDAVAKADELGWPVVLKTNDPRLSRRMEMGGIRLNIENETALRSAYLSMSAHLDSAAMARVVVQQMAPPGVPCIVSSVEDPLFGPVVSFGIGGVVPELLGDRAHRVPPLSDTEVRAFVRAPVAARLLFGHGGNPPVDIAAVEDLVARVARMAEDLPQVVRLDLNPIIASPRGAVVLSADVWLRRAGVRIDTEARRLAPSH